MRWYQHSTQGVLPITSPRNNAPAVATSASSQARNSGVQNVACRPPPSGATECSSLIARVERSQPSRSSQRQGNALSRLDLLLQVHHHDVQTTRLQLDRLASPQRHATGGAHPHDVLVHRHLVHFNDAGDRGTGSRQYDILLGRQPHEGACGRLVRHGGTSPGPFDRHLGMGGRRKANAQQRSEATRNPTTRSWEAHRLRSHSETPV